MAEIFANKLSEQVFSPAEIQGFLLKKDSRSSVRIARHCEIWRDVKLEVMGAPQEVRIPNIDN